MSNFQFLQAEWPRIFEQAQEAEAHAVTKPKYSAIMSRTALETAVKWLFDNDAYLQKPYNATLSSLLHDSGFKDILKPSMHREIDNVRRIGNNAAHGHRIKKEESVTALKYLFRFVCFVGKYYSEAEPILPEFDESILPTGEEAEMQRRQLELLLEKLEQQQDEATKQQKELEDKAQENELLRKQLADQALAFTKTREERIEKAPVAKTIPELVPEAATRRIYIDQLLKEAGWDNLRQGYELEYEVRGMPASTNPSGKGYADYVLWDDNGKPLAVIEAKSTFQGADKGRHQAKLYANCLEQMHGQRPIIFYTNGYESFIWDDTFYPPRKIYGFYTKDELRLTIIRRTERKDLRAFKVNTDIAGRPYQLEAIKHLAEHYCTVHEGILKGAQRKGLLVMATGTGKTRTATAITDMMTKCNWAKRILFLADRNALVTQAKKAFNTHLPNLSAIDLTQEKEDEGTRVVFSTYPTMLNKIDSLRNSDGRFYTPGHFDLIIIDEAHRSVYAKYGAIFEYFDALLLGLTATPKQQVDHNTYRLFELEDKNPTFAYELDQAVADHYLVPPTQIDVPVKFLREGIKYADLSDAEKEEYELKFGDPTEGAPDEIGHGALNKWLFNQSTVDSVLQHLMQCGIKVQGGDKIGKTIIFAANHQHAKFIEERFNALYPQYSGDFMRVIDNYESKAEHLLEQFKRDDVEVDPQIAVSVDMMDTGVDAPRVVNLVFFKAVYASSKFWQMVGRGTRLCPNLFGPNMDKSEFLILDYCGNLKYFKANPGGRDTKVVKTLTQQIFEAKLDVMQILRGTPDKNEAENQLEQEYCKQLLHQVKDLNHDRFEVMMHVKYVKRFEKEERWLDLTTGDVADIKAHLSVVVEPPKGEDEVGRRFDILMLRLMLATLTGKPSNLSDRVVSIAEQLSKKLNIPAVMQQKETIQRVQQTQFWQNVSPKRLEDVRVALRDLVKFLDAQKQEVVYTNFADEINLDTVEDGGVSFASSVGESYKHKIEKYVRDNSHHVAIQKLRTNQKLTAEEVNALEDILFHGDLGGRAEFEKAYGKQPLGAFIRSIVGLDKDAVQQAFADLLQTGNLSASQTTFLNQIINYFCEKGTIQPGLLFEAPFTNLHDQGITGLFEEDKTVKVISIIEAVNSNAEIA